MVDFEILSWDELVAYLERERGEPATEQYKHLVGRMNPLSRAILLATRLKTTVTRYGKVKMSFSWSNERVGGGHLPWTSENTRVLHSMMIMVLRLIELNS